MNAQETADYICKLVLEAEVEDQNQIIELAINKIQNARRNLANSILKNHKKVLKVSTDLNEKLINIEIAPHGEEVQA